MYHTAASADDYNPTDPHCDQPTRTWHPLQRLEVRKTDFLYRTLCMLVITPSSEPRKAPKPQPLGNIPFIFLFTTCTLCVVFLLWRRASTLRKVVAHQ